MVDHLLHCTYHWISVSASSELGPSFIRSCYSSEDLIGNSFDPVRCSGLSSGLKYTWLARTTEQIYGASTSRSCLQSSEHVLPQFLSSPGSRRGGPTYSSTFLPDRLTVADPYPAFATDLRPMALDHLPWTTAAVSRTCVPTTPDLLRDRQTQRTVLELFSCQQLTTLSLSLVVSLFDMLHYHAWLLS